MEGVQMGEHTEAAAVEPFRRSCFLFVRPSFIDGAAQVFNIGGRSHAVYVTSPTAVEADRRAARQDWLAVGDDLRHAMTKL